MWRRYLWWVILAVMFVCDLVILNRKGELVSYFWGLWMASMVWVEVYADTNLWVSKVTKTTIKSPTKLTGTRVDEWVEED